MTTSGVGSMGWSMDAQAASPAGTEAPTTLESTANTENPTGAETRAEIAAGAEARVANPATAEARTEGLAGTEARVEEPAGTEAHAEEPRTPGFRERGRMRRRVRFLRKARELAYRDLGGLVFEMQRLGQRHDELVAAKLSVLAGFDGELRALEAALGERWPITVLREAGIATCPRCAAIHGSDDRFCPTCGMPLGRHADRPIAAAPVAVAGAPATLAGAPVAAASTSGAALTGAAAGASGESTGAAAVSPAQLPLSASPSTGISPSTSAEPPPVGMSPSAPAHPPTGVPPRAPTPPAPAQRSAPQPPRSVPQPSRSPAPAATEEDQPTEIIRPQDDAK
jgi:hypothetical protein